MNNSAQNSAGLLGKSGQEVAKQSFGKTDARYWHDAIFKPTYSRNGQTVSVDEWAARIQWLGQRETFNLQTPNKAAAAAKARDIYTMLVGAGWDATLEKFKPEMQRKSVSTVGEFLSELEPHWPGKPKTFGDYSRSFRGIVAQIFGIKGGREKFDYATGGRDKWVAKIDRIKLADVTPERLNKWRIAFVKKAGENPMKQKRARITCNSLMRHSKSLFSPELLRHVAMRTPDKSPFDGVPFYPRESMRYHSTIDVEALIADAMRELPQEPLKAFLLAAMAGLRKNEADKLLWTSFRWNDGCIRIEATEHFTPKTQDSAGDVPVDPEVLAVFRGWHAKASGPFVIESDSEPLTGTSYTAYRCARHFDMLTGWLRGKGVSASKPLHELRKECGSRVCAAHGIHAASRLLRHVDITLTSAHYADATKRVTSGMGGLLSIPANVTPMPQVNGKVTPKERRASK